MKDICTNHPEKYIGNLAREMVVPYIQYIMKK